MWVHRNFWTLIRFFFVFNVDPLNSCVCHDCHQAVLYIYTYILFFGDVFMSIGMLFCAVTALMSLPSPLLNVTDDPRGPRARACCCWHVWICLLQRVNAACVVIYHQLSPSGWAVATVVAAVDAGAVVLAGAAFKASNAPSSVRIVAARFDIMPTRGRCLLCGERREQSSSCPCPRCHEFHAGGDAGCLNCAICGRWHAQDNCLSVFVAKC